MNKEKTKTWKRELATAMFLWLGVMTYDPENIEMVKVIVWPITMFGLGAFGIDSYSKQLQPKLNS